MPIRLMIALLLCSGCASTVPAAVAASGPAVTRTLNTRSLAGDWQMVLHVGPRLFRDRLQLQVGADGKITGSLTVTDRFSAPLEGLVLEGDELRFSIMADEPPHPFRVRYRGRLDEQGRFYVGHATLEDGSPMGGFVASREHAKD